MQTNETTYWYNAADNLTIIIETMRWARESLLVNIIEKLHFIVMCSPIFHMPQWLVHLMFVSLFSSKLQTTIWKYWQEPDGDAGVVFE